MPFARPERLVGRSVTPVASENGQRDPCADARLHLTMRPPPEPTYSSLGASRLGQIGPVGRFFVVVGVISAILIVLAVASIVLFALVAGDPGYSG